MFLRFSEIKFLPGSEIIILGIQYSEKIILHAKIRLSADIPSVFLMMGNCYGNLSCKDSFIINVNIAAPTISCGLMGMSWCIIFSLGCVCWNIRHVTQFLYNCQYCYLF